MRSSQAPKWRRITPIGLVSRIVACEEKAVERQSHFVSLLRGLLPDPKAGPPGGGGGATSDAQGLT